MSLARAFTTRRVRQTLDLRDNSDKDKSDTSPQRSRTIKMFGSSHTGSIRHKISAPVELTHTTNMLSYNAPDIRQKMALRTAPKTKPPPMRTISASTKTSDDDSDSVSTAASTPPTSPETSFHEDARSLSPEPNHLSCYFTPPQSVVVTKPTDNNATTAPGAQPNAAFPAAAAPAIPQRAPSHTKKTSEGLARHRSVSRMSELSVRSLSSKASFSFSRSSSTSGSFITAPVSRASSVSHNTMASLSSFTASTTTLSPKSIAEAAEAAETPLVSHRKEYSETHPFGHELAKVSELVEEFGKDKSLTLATSSMIADIDPVIEEEERELIRLGFKKYSAEDYLSEIQGLMSSFLADSRPVAAMWI